MPSAARPKQAFEPHLDLSSPRLLQQQTIQSLREMLDRKQSHFTQQTAAQMLYFEGFHGLLPQGVPRGSMNTISGAPCSGKTSLALALASSITRSGGYAAIVDGTGHMFPPALRTYEARLSHLLLVRVPRGERNRNQKGARLFWASNQVIRSGLFDLVVLLGLKQCHLSSIRQLQLSSEQSPSALLVVHSKQVRLPGAFFHARIELEDAHALSESPGLNSPIAAPMRHTVAHITERGRTTRSSSIAHL